MRHDTPRTRASARSLLIIAMCAAVATACGSAAVTGGTSGGASGKGAAATAKPAKVSLNITVTSRPGAKPRVWTLRCQPTGGTYPNPAAACRVLLHAKDPFAALPRGFMCPMIAFGTGTATVRGTWFGKPVDRTPARGGCGPGGWRKIGPVFN